MGTTPDSFAQYALADHRHVLPVPHQLRPVLDSTLSFDTANQAVERLRSHRAHGKTVLTVP